MTQPTPPIPDNGWEQKFDKQFPKLEVYDPVEGCTDPECCSPYKVVNYDVKEFIQQQLHTAIEEERKRFVEKEMLPFLDELEMREPEYTKQDHWRHWKYIRNNLRDNYSPSDKETTE